MEFLCNNFTLEEPNFKNEFLSHPSSSLISNPNQYYNHNYPSNELFPISNYYQNDVLYHPNDSISSQTTNESCDHNSHFSSLLQNDACFSIDDIFMMNQTNFEPLDYVFSSGLDHVLGNVHQGLVEDDESINYLGSSYTSLVTHDNLEEASPKKKARLYKDNRGKKSIELRKDKEENESNSKSEGEILEDESKTTQESNELKSWASKETCKGKKRASRGAATDPQSLYARRRREKINERLRILQNLIPNGTKVDISTMLEEASHYVKFLQLQIQLLSSDELWMYAPIAYNGVDITHYKRISPFLLS